MISDPTAVFEEERVLPAAAPSRPAPPKLSRRRSRKLEDREPTSKRELVVRYTILLVAFVIAVGPFVYQLSTSLKGQSEDIYGNALDIVPNSPSLGNYRRVADAVDIWAFGRNSLSYAFISVVGNVVGATIAGFALARLQFRGRRLLLGLFMVSLVLPAEVTIMSQFQTILKLGLDNSILGVALPGAISALNVLLMMNAFKAIPPAVEEAAIIDGANVWDRLRYIGIPSVKGTISVVAIFAFIGAWDDFLWPLIVLTDPGKLTLTVGLNYLKAQFGSDPRLIAAGTMIVLLPILVFFVCLQRFFFKGVGEGGVKG